MEYILNATQIKEIIEHIPADKFIIGLYTDMEGNSCFLGHIHRHFDETNCCGDGDGFGARQLTQKFLNEVHGLCGESGANVNNGPYINGYNEPVIKDRVMHMINDMIEKGY